jgi:hypothetical protein
MSQEPSKIGVPVRKDGQRRFRLQALLVYSANDMAYVLAEGASGSIELFADEMNATAKRLGLTASHFMNPNGLFDPRHVTSARDMAVLAAVIVAEFPEYQKYFVQQYLEVGKRRLPNRNILIRTMPDADGMKTGFRLCLWVQSCCFGNAQRPPPHCRCHGHEETARRARRQPRPCWKQALPCATRRAARWPTSSTLPQGAIVPVDMTGTVCRSKPPVSVQDGTVTGGMGRVFWDL